MATALSSVEMAPPAGGRSPTSQPGLERSAAPSKGLPNADFLLESVVCDIHSLSLHVGTLTTLVMACLRPGTTWNLSACRHLLHDEFKALCLALRYGAEMGLGDEATQKITNLCRDIAEAQKRLTPMLSFSASTKSQRDQLQSVSGVWRRLANDMISALAMIDPTVRTRLKPIYVEDASTLREFLKRAADGDTKAVDEAGVMRGPALKQRRRGPRVVANIPCKLETEAGIWPAKLEDVSRHGLGIVCSQPFSHRQKVKVVLNDGRRISATVVRAKNPRYGVTLEQPLSEQDPLLTGGGSEQN